MFKNKSVLITGGAGFVGSNLIIKMLDLGANVRATLHKKIEQVKSDRVQYMKCDLMKIEDCDRVTENVEYVFMCAANTSGAAVIENTPLAHVTPNILMNTLMLDSAYRSGVKKFLFISSNTVYPPYTHAVKEEEMMTGELYEKYFCVGWMKRFTEILCEMYTSKIKKPMTTVVVRPANIFGEYDDFDWETSHVLPALMRKVIEHHEPIEVWGDGTDCKDFIYIDDFIDGIIKAMEYDGNFLNVNLASGKPVIVQEALKIMLEIEGYSNAKVVYNKDKPSMIPVRILSTEKAEKLLGFKTQYTFKEGIMRTMAWYKKEIEKV